MTELLFIPDAFQFPQNPSSDLADIKRAEWTCWSSMRRVTSASNAAMSPLIHRNQLQKSTRKKSRQQGTSDAAE
jgi:hypothetical protein